MNRLLRQQVPGQLERVEDRSKVACSGRADPLGLESGGAQ
jgi:hypothetical protein